MTTTILRERLENVLIAQAVDSRFKYAEKKCIGYGGAGVVYEDGLDSSGNMVVQKVNLITREHIHHYPKKGIVPLDYVLFEDDAGWGKVVFRREGDSYEDVHSLIHADFYRLKHAVYEYQNLRAVRGVSYFQQVVEEEYASKKGEVHLRDREFFLLDGQLCLRKLMKKVPGVSLDSLFIDYKNKGTGEINPRDVVKIGYDLSCALIYLGDQKQIVHRDIKPGNIVFDSEKTYLIDFGNSMLENDGLNDPALLDDIALLLKKDHGSMFTGTPGFISPEVVLHNPITRATDIWSLGCTLFYMMSGKMPFQSDVEGARFKTNMRGNLRSVLEQSCSYNLGLIEGVCEMFAHEPEARSLDRFMNEAKEVLNGSQSLLRTEVVFIPSILPNGASITVVPDSIVFGNTFVAPHFFERTTMRI